MRLFCKRAGALSSTTPVEVSIPHPATIKLLSTRDVPPRRLSATGWRPLAALMLLPATVAHAPDSQRNVARFAFATLPERVPDPPHRLFATIDVVVGEAAVTYTADESGAPTEAPAPARPRMPSTEFPAPHDELQNPCG